jgi:hypothetical protein
MSVVLAVAQLLGVLAVLAGVYLLLPLGAALVVSGALVLVLATAAEVAVSRRPAAPSAPRSRADTAGVA